MIPAREVGLPLCSYCEDSTACHDIWSETTHLHRHRWMESDPVSSRITKLQNSTNLLNYHTSVVSISTIKRERECLYMMSVVLTCGLLRVHSYNAIFNQYSQRESFRIRQDHLSYHWLSLLENFQIPLLMHSGILFNIYLSKGMYLGTSFFSGL